MLAKPRGDKTATALLRQAQLYQTRPLQPIDIRMDVAIRLAAHLDALEFEKAGELLAEDCDYQYWEGNYRGRDAIINIYRQMSQQDKETFNEHSTRTTVEQTSPDTFILHGHDTMRIDDLTHESKFDEIVRVTDGMISSIEYKALRGEAEKLREFFIAAGLINQ
jgi:hypothetical protein